MKRCNGPYFRGLPRNHGDHLRNKKENHKDSSEKISKEKSYKIKKKKQAQKSDSLLFLVQKNTFFNKTTSPYLAISQKRF